MSTNPRFELVDETQVLDRETGLTWTQGNMPGGRMTHEEAVAACSKLSLGGHADWRLPTRKELLTLVDDTRFDPAIDPIFACKPNWYWTSTPYAPVEGCAWLVYFNDGGACGNDRVCGGFVRAVRGGQSIGPLAREAA